MEIYSKKQEEIHKRKAEKEMEIKASMSEKITKQKIRETKLNETKMRYEGEIESFKKDLSERLEKINERVSLIDKYSLSILDNKEKGRKL
jgi:hypothetical protein